MSAFILHACLKWRYIERYKDPRAQHSATVHVLRLCSTLRRASKWDRNEKNIRTLLNKFYCSARKGVWVVVLGLFYCYNEAVVRASHHLSPPGRCLSAKRCHHLRPKLTGVVLHRRPSCPGCAGTASRNGSGRRCA